MACLPAAPGIHHGGRDIAGTDEGAKDQGQEQDEGTSHGGGRTIGEQSIISSASRTTMSFINSIG